MKRNLAAAIVLAALACGGSAGAQDKAACLEASSQAQVLRDAHKLVETRAKLRICSHQECPTVVQQDCAAWLEEVERSLPTVVLSATDGAGRPLVNVTVSVDGKVVQNQLDGLAMTLDPGPHRLRLEAVTGAFYDRRIVVAESEKKRLINVVLGKPTEVAPPEDATKSMETPPDMPTDDMTPATSGGSALRTAAFVVGSVGLAGLVVGTVFGVLAVGSKDQAGCTPDGYCAPGRGRRPRPRRSASSRAESFSRPGSR